MIVETDYFNLIFVLRLGAVDDLSKTSEFVVEIKELSVAAHMVDFLFVFTEVNGVALIVLLEWSCLW